MDGEDEALDGVLAELELQHDQGPKNPLSETSIASLQSLFDAGDGGDVWNSLSARKLHASALIGSISSAMESGSSRLSLVASKLYLSIILAPTSPVYTLFDPVTFFALLGSLRRSTKPQQQADGASSMDRGSSVSWKRNVKQRDNIRKRKRRDGGRRDCAVGAGEERGDLVGLLVEILKLFELALSRVRLDRTPDGVKSLVETVVAIVDSKIGQHLCVPDMCFRIFYAVVSKPEHGDQTLTSAEVMRSLTKVVLSQTKSTLRADARQFVIGRIMPMGKENGAIQKAVTYFPRYLAMNAPEKSEPRACAVDSILEIVKAMDHDDQIGFVRYVVKMCHGKASSRLLAVDLNLALITTLPDPFDLGDLRKDGDGVEERWGMRCLQALIQRCSDSVAGIRARALTNTALVVEHLSKDTKNNLCLKKVMGLGDLTFNDLLRKRCRDDKAAVRKAALVLIAKSTEIIGGPIDGSVLKMMGHACSDPLVSIRRAALWALSKAFKKFLDGKVISEWLHAVLPLIMDNETSIQEECENIFLELVLDWIFRIGSTAVRIPDELLALMKEMCHGDMAVYVKKICTSLGKKNKLKPAVASSLQNIITSSESEWLSNSMPLEKWTAPSGAWLLLSELSTFVPKAISWKFLHHHWKLLDKTNTDGIREMANDIEFDSVSWATDLVSLLQIISNVSTELPPEPAADLAHNLLKRVEGFNMPLIEVDAHVKALRTLCKQKAMNPEEGETIVAKWVHQLLAKALKILESYMSKLSDASGPTCFTTPQNGKKKEKNVIVESKSTSQAFTAVFTVGTLVLICPSADVKDIIPLLHTLMTSGSPESKSKRLAGFVAPMKETVSSLYIQSWVTMGKICLVDGKLAKHYIPLFVQELENSDSAALRNNILLVMVDFCVRHTALVDCYIPKIANLLRDPCEIIRRQTFVLLSRLLQRDYVKWKGVLFLRFLLPLVDESKKIKHLADFLFGNILKVKAPLLAYNSFVETIFVLNDCRAHSGHNENSKTGSQLFSLRGSDDISRAKRMHIYVSLLKQMAPEQLLATSAKLCAEILAAASDGLLNLDDVTAQCVLQDSLEILSCKEMRIQPARGTHAADMEEEDGDSGALSAARGRAVTEVSKKNLIQHAVPIFIELKRLLESKNSPLTGCLMECLCVLLKDYKNEIEDILIAEKQLQKELIYDMQKYEAAKARSTVSQAVFTMRRTDSSFSPILSGNRCKVYGEVSEKLGIGKKFTCAVADVAAKETARSVMKEFNGKVPTPSIHTMSLPQVRTSADENAVGKNLPVDVLQSVRKRLIT